MVVTCAVFGCLSSSRHDKDRSFFHFPRDESRCKQWIRATGRPELLHKSVETLKKSYLICDMHFNATDRLVKKLKTNAVPSVMLPDAEDMQRNKSTQTEEYTTYSIPLIKREFPLIDATSQTDYFVSFEKPSNSRATQTTQTLTASAPRKRMLLRKFKSEFIKRNRLEEALALSSTHLKKSNISPQLQKLIDIQNKLKHHSRGNRYDNELKLFALSIFFASPLAYRVLANVLSLPNERTLRRININIGTKVSSSVLNCLESKIRRMKELQKYCTICVDEMPIKKFLFYQMNTDKIIGFHEIDEIQTTEPATHAFVVMARGIYSNWKLPLGYCFLSSSKNYNELSTWLDDIITNMFNIGLHVVAFVSDQKSNLAKDRNVTIEQPYFYINEKKIFYIFDIPRIMKSVRNNLIKYDFEYNDVDATKLIASWQSVEALYREDSKRVYRLAPKLTNSHIRPNNAEKRKVKFATQLFSKTVATAMNCYIEFGLLQNSSLGTVKFIELINNSFDILNASGVSDSMYKKPFSAKPYQIEILNKLLLFLSNVVVRHKSTNKDMTNVIKCLKALHISVISIMDLAEGLRTKGFRFLLTRRLNLDPLESFFGSIRQQCGGCREPTPVQFSRAFRKIFMVSILNHAQSANCSENLDTMHLKTADINTILDNLPNLENLTDQSDQPSIVSVATGDYRLDLPEENAFTYLCGYLLEKCHNMHKCEKINSYIKIAQTICKEENANVESNNENSLLINPPDTFVTLIKSMEERLRHVFGNKIIDCIGNEIIRNMHDIHFDHCCPCFPNDYLKKLFVRFRIFNLLRFNNRNFRDRMSKIKYFCVTNI